MSPEPNTGATTAVGTAAQRLEAILRRPVPADSTRRREAVRELFLSLSPVEAAQLLARLREPDSLLYKMMRRRLSRSLVPDLLSLLGDDQVEAQGTAGTDTNARGLGDRGTADRGVNTEDLLTDAAALGVRLLLDRLRSKPTVKSPPDPSKLLTQQPVYIDGRPTSATRLDLSDDAAEEMKAYRKRLIKLLDSDDPVEALWAHEELSILDMAESYGVLHGWALMFSYGNFNPKDITHRGKLARLRGGRGRKPLIEGHKWLPVDRDPRFGDKKTFVGAYRSLVLDQPEVIELIKGVTRYRAAFALGVRRGQKSMLPSWYDSVFDGLDVLGGVSDFADLAGIVAVFAKARRLSYVDDILNRAIDLPRAVARTSKAAAGTADGLAIVKAIIGRSRRLLAIVTRRDDFFRSRIIVAIRNANPNSTFAFAAYQAHHIIPKQVIKKGAVFIEAIRRGIFDPDGVANGLLLRIVRRGKTEYVHPVYGKVKKLPVHRGSHPRYTDYAIELQEAELAKLIGKKNLQGMSIKQLAAAIETISDTKIKNAIERIQQELVRFMQTKAARSTADKLTEAGFDPEAPDQTA